MGLGLESGRKPEFSGLAVYGEGCLSGRTVLLFLHFGRQKSFISRAAAEGWGLIWRGWVSGSR